MKRLILLLLLFILISCASFPSSASMESRTYDICEDLSGFCWSHDVCAKKFLGICIKRELAIEKIEAEFKDKIQAKQLYDMNFVLKVRVKPI